MFFQPPTKYRRGRKLGGGWLINKVLGSDATEYAVNRLGKRFRSLAIGIFLPLMLVASPSYGLGLGTVSINSYIGEELAASIPVLSVSNISNLVVEITPLNNVNLQSEIGSINGQSLILIRSDQLINEPYVQFSLRVVDQEQILVREFTVLLDIKQDAFAATQGTDTSVPFNTPQIFSEQVANTAIADILGPYEWAEAGRIPARFGPVLDGQSLWRVARRINSAMGVTIEQMMWALYTKNPQAFSNETIESLRAGVILDIPRLYEVSNTSTVQATRNIDGVSANNLIVKPVDSTVSTDEVVVDDSAELGTTDQNQQFADADRGDSESETSNQVDAEFKLSGLDDMAGVDPNNLEGANARAMETINVLSVTVGNLTQELINKDKQIEYLEGKIQALEGVAALDSIGFEFESETLATVSQVDDTQVADSPDPINSLEPVGGAEQLDVLETVDIAETTTVVPELQASNSEIEVIPDTLDSPELENDAEPIQSVELSNSRSLIQPWVLWLGLGVIALLGLLALRNKLKALNLFGGEDNIDFPTQMTTGQTNEHAVKNKNFSDLSASNKAVKEPEAARSDDDEYDEYSSYSDISINYIDEDVIAEVQNEIDTKNKAEAQEIDFAKFEKELESLVESENYVKVVDLLESARKQVIDEDRYFFERLRCFFLDKDEDGFYAFYDEIEYNIQHFPENWNRQISEMVIELGQKV